jgi:hypothetical protein
LRAEGLQEAKMIGCLPLGQEAIGFAIPIFAHPLDPILLAVQEIDELGGRVRGFRTLEPTESNFLHVTGPSVRIGDEPHYAFIAAAGSIHLGTLKTLRPKLAQFVGANPARRGLTLQIRELVGTDQEKKIARAEMRTLLLEQQGSAAARSFYEGSVLRSVLWSRLLSVADNNKEMAKRILAARGQLSANVSPEGKIALELAALSQEDLAALDTSKLIESILLEYDPQPNASVATTNLRDDDTHNFMEVQRDVEVLLNRMLKTGRQEERIALIISAILRNPSVGKTALLQYETERAKTAEWAIKELRKTFIDTSWPSDERVVASLIPKLFTQQYPMTRGDLLFFLAKHLGSWPEINRSIRECLAKTHSMYVELRRSEIEEALAQLDVL